MALVVPRSFLTASHHENTRNGRARGFRLTEVWDLERVQNLFRVPSAVLWATQAHVLKQVPPEGIAGRVYAGRPPRHNAQPHEVAGRVQHAPARYYLSTMGRNTALATQAPAPQVGENPYHARFRQGATIVPRCFYFIENLLPTPPDWHNRLLPCRTLPLPEAKPPWSSLKLSGKLSSDFFFRTALAKNLAPFALIQPPLVFIPAEIVEENFRVLDYDTLIKEGHLSTAKWVADMEVLWDAHKTDSSKGMTVYDRLNYQRGVVSQELSKPYLVLYSASAKDANAVVLERSSLDLPFVVECTAYYFSTDSLDEANYIAAFLNSSYANNAIKVFQAKGLFGPRHVHKKILDVPLPLYDPTQPAHQRLAALGAECATLANHTVHEMQLPQGTYAIGKVRTALRAALATPLAQIDELLAQLG